MSSAPAPISSSQAANDLVRRILRVEPAAGERTVRSANRAMSSSIFLSAVRCVLTYLVIPIAGPALHFTNSVGRPLSIGLCLLAGYFSIRSMRRFWAANHRYRWPYSVFASTVLAYMAYGIATDVAHLI